jgi:hypothetical protein
MRALTVILALSAVWLLGGTPPAAQEGHPLKGSWIGTWGPNHNQGDDLLLVLSWDGKNITGTINPGTDNIAIKNATLNPDGWVVRFEADAKAKSGKPITYVVEGKLANLPLPNRTLTGTWKNEEESGALKLARQ